MNILSVDVGSYSIKFIESTFDRKKLIHDNMNQVVIHDFQRDFPVEISLEEVQQEIIKEYLKKRGSPSKFIYQIPAKFLTNRMMSFPIKNKRLVAKAIPFQIEKDLLYGGKEYHFDSQILPTAKGTTFKENYVIASIIENTTFDQMIKDMSTNHTLPDILTSEVSLFQSYVARSQKEGSFAILDIGHETTKSYFFINGKLIASHLSYVAGQSIDEIISETYMIPLEDAISYKHQKAFFITKKQAESLQEDQRIFGTMMSNLFNPLIDDFKKWELGHRIKTGNKLEKIYITGGTSCIKNIDNYISIHIGVPVEKLDILNPFNLHQISLSTHEKIPFSLAHIMAESFSSKILPINFRVKGYAPKNVSFLPLHSLAFLSTRVMLISGIFFIGFSIDKAILIFKEKSIDKKAPALLRRSEFNLIKREVTMFSRNPKSIYEKMRKTKKNINSEFGIIEDFFKKSSIDILLLINQKLTLTDEIELTKLEHRSGKIFAHFKAKDKKSLEDLQHKISALPFNDNKVQVYDKNLTLNWEFIE